MAIFTLENLMYTLTKMIEIKCLFFAELSLYHIFVGFSYIRLRHRATLRDRCICLRCCLQAVSDRQGNAVLLRARGSHLADAVGRF